MGRADEAWKSRRGSAAFALAALLLYPAAILMPVLHIEKLGHSSDDSVVTGVGALVNGGHYFIAAVVFVFSLVVPPLKLGALLALCFAARSLAQHHRRWTHLAVEALGRWGMLDVFVVAVLVAYVKLGSAVNIAPGPGLVAFAGCVLLSLVASLLFPARLVWSRLE